MRRSNLSRFSLWLTTVGALLAATVASAQETGPLRLESGERVALIGDALIDDEAAQGIVEHAFLTQAPTKSIRVRNLGWILTADQTNAPAGRRVTTNALATLRQHLGIFRPTIAVVGFGQTTGVPEPEALTNDVDGVLATIQESAGTNRIRLVLMSPLRWSQAAPPLDLASINQRAAMGTTNLGILAAQRGARFVNLFQELHNEKLMPPPPPLFAADGRLTEYGTRRLAELVARTLGFEPPAWRFGVLPDGRMRDGGFGIRLLEVEKTAERARLVVQPQNVSMPPLPASQSRAYFLSPSNRMQIAGMNPGNYDFKIDGQTVGPYSAEMLNRSIIVRMDAYDQRAEALRQAIVRQNQLVRARWSDAASLSPDEAKRLDQQLAEVADRIVELRVPAKRVFEIVPSAPGAGVSP